MSCEMLSREIIMSCEMLIFVIMTCLLKYCQALWNVFGQNVVRIGEMPLCVVKCGILQNVLSRFEIYCPSGRCGVSWNVIFPETLCFVISTCEWSNLGTTLFFLVSWDFFVNCYVWAFRTGTVSCTFSSIIIWHNFWTSPSSSVRLFWRIFQMLSLLCFQLLHFIFQSLFK